MIYILHFVEKYHHAQHYVGYTKNPIRRFEEHFNVNLKSKGSPLIKAVLRAGIEIKIALVKSGTRKDERRIKKFKNTKKFCPICTGEKSG